MGTKRGLLRCCLMASFLFFRCGSLLAQSDPHITTIRVRLVDYKTGKRLKGHKVWLWLSDGDGELTQHPVTLASKTGKDGIAVFQMATIPPPKMWVDLGIGDWACASTGEFSTSDLLQNGMGVNFQADSNLCKSPPATFPDPCRGVITFAIRHLNLWLQVRRSIEQ
jgi:hypothetical protein